MSDKKQDLCGDFFAQITKATIEQLIAGSTQTLVAICTIIGMSEAQGEDQKKIAMDGICDVTNELYNNLTMIRQKIGYKNEAQK